MEKMWWLGEGKGWFASADGRRGGRRKERAKKAQNKGAGTDCLFINVAAWIIMISCMSEDRGLDSKGGWILVC